MSESCSPVFCAEHCTLPAIQESRSHAWPGGPDGWCPVSILFERKKGKRNDQRKITSSLVSKIWLLFESDLFCLQDKKCASRGGSTLRKHNPVQIDSKESRLCQKWTYRWSRSVFLMKTWQISNWSDQGFSWAAGFQGDPQSNQQCGDLPEWRVWTVWLVIMRVGQTGLFTYSVRWKACQRALDDVPHRDLHQEQCQSETLLC